MRKCIKSRYFAFSTGLLALFFLIAGVNSVAFAQLQDGSTPASFGETMLQKSIFIIPSTSLAAIDTAAMRELDRKEGVNNRYGVVDSVLIDIRKEGVKTVVNNMNVWRYELTCSNALSLGLQFSTFDIPQGAALYIYSPDLSTVRGAFTTANVKDDGRFSLADLEGSNIVIEYDEPVSAEFEGGVVLGGVVKSYESVSASANSRIQINCPEGADWQDEKRAVCLITFNDSQYSYYCSGSLVNNVREDETPYFLTANHCITTSSEAGTLVAYFNYEMSGCTTYDAVKSQSLSGATLKATNVYSDFTLLLLSEEPPVSYAPYFLGWDANGSVAETGTCIHHPAGSSKCIALDYASPVSNDYSIKWDDGTTSQVNSHWEVSYDAGTDEGGSSGGPLMDQNKRVIGQLHGGDDSSSLFGKFSLSWNYRSESSRQLKAWLDPDNTGVKQLDGLDGYSNPIAAFSVSETIACLSESIQLTDASRSAESWSWSVSPSTYTFVNGTSANSENPEILFQTEGTYTISLTVANENGTDELVKSDLVEVYSTLPVAWVDVADEITVCGWELDSYEMVAEGAPYFAFSLTDADKFDVTAQDSLLVLTLTDDAKTEGSFDTYITVTGTHGSCEAADSVLMHVIIPVNDNVAQALALKLGDNGTYSNECGSVQDKEPAPATAGCSVENNWCPPSGDSVLDNSIWFYFEGPSSGHITVVAEGISSQLAVYRAISPSYILSGSKESYILVAAADNGVKSTGTATELEMNVTAGAKYWLQVDGKDGAEGDISLTLLANSIEVYPNPSTGIYHLTVASETDGEANLSVFNQTGQLVYAGQGTFNQQSNTIDFNLGGQPAGIYYFRAIINGVVMSKKLILLH